MAIHGQACGLAFQQGPKIWTYAFSAKRGRYIGLVHCRITSKGDLISEKSIAPIDQEVSLDFPVYVHTFYSHAPNHFESYSVNSGFQVIREQHD